jgi:putative copper export protein
MQKLIVFGIVRSLHNVFTALWIGGLLTTALTFMPAFMNKGDKAKKDKSIVMRYQKRLRVVALISIIGLWITGLLLGKQTSAYSGFMSFATTYETLISIKHLLILVMILVAVYRGYILGPKFEQFKPQQQKLYAGLLFLNALLGVIVLFLSGISAAIP